MFDCSKKPCRSSALAVQIFPNQTEQKRCQDNRGNNYICLVPLFCERKKKKRYPGNRGKHQEKKPKLNDAIESSQGLFIARTPEFLDPQTYLSGRKVTVAGEIIGEKLGKFKETPYVYPIIKIREIHPWEKEHSIQWDWGKLPFYIPDEFNLEEEYHRPLRP